MKTPGEFNVLRAKARENHDKAIAAAREEYAAVLAHIAALEHDLYGGRSSRRQPMSACVQSVIPREEPFTIADIVARLEGLEPGRIWHRKSIGTYVAKIAARGLLRRLDRHRGPAPTLYVRAGANVPKRPFEGMTLTAVLRGVLTKPMNQTELTVRILEGGYSTITSRKALRKQIGELLAMPGSGFVKDGEKWTALEEGSSSRPAWIRFGMFFLDCAKANLEV